MADRDTLRAESPAGIAELDYLKGVALGDIRKNVLFPALDADVEWICTGRGENYWEFIGLFCGQPISQTVTVTKDAEKLTLSVKAVKEPS
jgi:hypothetical protein